MVQQELIEAVHAGLKEKAPFAAIVHSIADAITKEGETSLTALLGRLEPASIAYVHAHPEDILDGPWDI